MTDQTLSTTNGLLPINQSIISVDDKIHLTTTIASKLVDLLHDPQQGKPMEGELRNKLRIEYADDLHTCIDQLSILAYCESGHHDIISIAKKLESGNTKSV